MKKITLLFSAMLLTIASFAAKTTATVTAGPNAGYTVGAALEVTGLSAEEVGYHGTLTLIVMSWDETIDRPEGYAGMLQLNGEEAAFCDNGLMVTKNQDQITITGKMLGYPYDYQIDVQVEPRKSSVIPVVSDNMEVAPDVWEPNDLKLTAFASGYAIEVSLFGGMEKKYGTYTNQQLYISINNTTDTLVYNTVATFSLEGELAKFEATCVHGIDTLALSLTGEPYVDPADILPTDSVRSTIYEAYIGKMSGFNTVSAKNEQIELKIQVPNGNWLEGVTNENFSYGSYLKVAGQKLTILRGNLKVVESGDDKVATIGILCSDNVWYDITATTAAVSTAVEDIHNLPTAEKVMRNGQLILIKNGIQYNANGAKL